MGSSDIRRKMLSVDDSVHLVAVGLTGLKHQMIQNCSPSIVLNLLKIFVLAITMVLF